MKYDARKQVIRSLIISASIIVFILVMNIVLADTRLKTSSATRNLSPSLEYLFGTDWLGRDMFTRIIKGLTFSVVVGLIGATVSVVIAIFLGVISAFGNKYIESVILWLIDMFIGMPHLIFMILISFIMGKGAQGVIIATALTHWPALTRVIRNEVVNIKNTEYVKLSLNMGKSKWYITKEHILISIFPQILVGFILLFPHVILHEASMTFLGFGLSAEQPSIGIILSEATKHISVGHWHLVILPGLALVTIVKSFDTIGEALRILNNPQTRYMKG